MRIITLKAAITTKDPSWDNLESLSWSIIELNSAIICNNLPSLRLLVVRSYPDLDPHSAQAALNPYQPTRQRSTTQPGSRAGDEEDGGHGTEDLKTVARCFSGRWRGGSQVALMGNEHGMGHILVTTDTTVVSGEAPARGPGPQASFSWEERTLGGEDGPRL